MLPEKVSLRQHTAIYDPADPKSSDHPQVTFPTRQHFSHTPPPGVIKRWPGSWDYQYFQDTVRPQTLIPCQMTIKGTTTTTGMMHVTIPACTINLPTFMDIAAIVLAKEYLGDEERSALERASPVLHQNSVLLNTWVSKP